MKNLVEPENYVFGCTARKLDVLCWLKYFKKSRAMVILV